MSVILQGSQNPQYKKLLPRYTLIRDCINDDVEPINQTDFEYEGDNQKRRVYLTRTPGMSDATYNLLKQLGRFTNVTGSTLEFMMGAAFRNDPEFELPATADYLLENADGEGNSLKDLVKQSVSEAIPLGRYAILVEPPTQMLDDDGNVVETTRRDVNEGKARTYLKPYLTESIVDWDISVVNGVKTLSFVKLKEIITKRDENYNVTQEERFRFLILDDSGYRQEVHSTEEGGSMIGQPVFVTDFNGKVLDHIPFFFVGSKNNDPDADNPPFFKMSNINIAHYNLDAENRLNLKLYATGTMVVWGDNASAFKDKTLSVGGGSGIYVGKSGGMDIKQLDAGKALPEAMENDMNSMIQLGAKVASYQNQRTAEEAKINASQEVALINIVVDNTEDAFTKAVNEAIWLQTGNEQSFKLELNKQFYPDPMTAQDRAQWQSDVSMEYVPLVEYWAALRRSGLTNKTDKELMQLMGSQPDMGGNDGN